MPTRRQRFRPLATTLLAALAAGSACVKDVSGGDSAADEAKSDAEDDEADSTDDESPTPSVPGFGMSPFAQLFKRSLEKPGPYEEPKQSADFTEGAPHFLVMDLDKPVTELESMSMLASTPTVPLRDLTERIADASSDANVRGLIVRLGPPGSTPVDMATAQEIRDALVAFKGSGDKAVWCHTSGAGNATYYVLTACDRLALAPLGQILISGPVATPIHVKGLLDRLGIVADFLHVGAFKGAAEPLTRSEPSPETLTTLEAVVDHSYQTLLEGLQTGRGLEPEAAIAAVDRAMFTGEEAVAAELVDEVASWATFREVASEGSPWKRVGPAQSPFERLDDLPRFLGFMPPARPSEPHVALVYAVGNIVDGNGGGLVGARQHIASRQLAAALRAISADDNVKAVVLRVNSGGGSALASEHIWEAASELATAKPLVVSMGAMAASGGYYISAPAAKVYAHRNTLTGSIGVVGGKLVFGNALRNLGVSAYTVSRGQRATLYSTLRPWNRDERRAIQGMMEATYDRFLKRVASGRSLTREAVHAVAQGRVWTGADAKTHGLVDEIGGLEAALAHAHRMAGLDPGGALEVYPPDPTLRDLLVASIGEVQARTELVHQLKNWPRTALGTELARSVERIMTTILELRNTPLWTVTLLDPPR